MRGGDWWHRWFLGMAAYVATASKDPSTQVGAVIVGPNKAIVSTGFNGFPSVMWDRKEWYADREEKLSRIIHAEMNALLFANSPTQGCTLYTHPCIPCDRCMVYMLQAGITKFVAPTPSAEVEARWGAAFERTRSYAKESGVMLMEIKPCG